LIRGKETFEEFVIGIIVAPSFEDGDLLHELEECTRSADDGECPFDDTILSRVLVPNVGPDASDDGVIGRIGQGVERLEIAIDGGTIDAGESGGDGQVRAGFLAVMVDQ